MLDIYASFLNINPYTFFGINYTEGDYLSDKIWTPAERAQVLHAMTISRLELEQNLGYLLTPTMTTAEPHLHNHSTVRLNHAFVIALGAQTITDLADGTLDYDTEPATLQITTATPDNLHIYHPSSGEEITVSERIYADDLLTISIPRYVLLKDTNNPAEGWVYSDLDNFVTSVSVKSVVHDASLSAQSGFSLSLVNSKMGLLEVLSPAFSQTFYNRCLNNTTMLNSQIMLINYQSGLQELGYLLKSIWVDFTHARLDIQPAEEPSVKLKWLWARDIPKEMSILQRECPFGQFSGAYQAWRYVAAHRVHRASPL